MCLDDYVMSSEGVCVACTVGRGVLVLVLALCFLSVASLTIAANGRVSATVRFHRASVGGACLVQLLTSSATTYSSFGVHALFGA